MLPEFLRTVLVDIDQASGPSQSRELEQLASTLRAIDASPTPLEFSSPYSLIRHSTQGSLPPEGTFTVVDHATGRTFRLVPYPPRPLGTVAIGADAGAFSLVPYPADLIPYPDTGQDKKECPNCGHRF